MKKNSLILLLIILVSCGMPKTSGSEGTPATIIPEISATSTNPIAPPPQTIQAPTLIPDPTAEPDNRLPPERWREWPIVPSVTSRAIEIYRTGQAMNLDPHAFSKVGDCQSVKAAFMGYFDIPERYSLGNDYAFLQETIDNFSGHFNTDGQAVRGGFNAAAVLSPLWADPHACLPGENPLECEMRITKPLIVIVSLEVWWDGRTPEQYATLMRRILDTIIAHGSVPILATKADNVEGDNSLNFTTAKLAHEYDLPLWNFWAAVQPLPAHGMDMKRNDGFHISTEAWSTRSFTGLEALDNVWRGLLKAGAFPKTAATQSMNLTNTPGLIVPSAQNLAPTSTPTAGATPTGGSNRIVFGLTKRQGEGYESLGVFMLDPIARQTRQVFGKGVSFQSASLDGKYILVSEGSNLYRTNVDGAYSLLLSNTFYSFGNSGAIWLPNGQIAALVTAQAGSKISIYSVEAALVGDLPILNEAPVGLFPSLAGNSIYWESGSCSAPGICQTNGTWLSSLDGKLNQALTGITRPAISPDGAQMITTTSSISEQNRLLLASPDGTNARSIPLPGNLLVDYAWSPSGNRLAAVVALRSDYTGKVSGNRNFIMDSHSLAIIELPQTTLLNPSVVWSPDGSSLFWIGTLPGEGGFKIGGSLISLDSKKVSDLGDAIGQADTDYLTVTNAAWLRLP